jgi:hypothetical protein
MDSDADRGNGVEHGELGEEAAGSELVERFGEGDVSTRYGGRARPAVGLDDIAVERDGALPQRVEVHNCAEASAHETLDLVGSAAAHQAAAGTALGAGAGEHAVLRGDPAALGAQQESRNLVEHGGSADDHGIAELDEARALGVLVVAGAHGDRSELIVGAAVGPRHRRFSARRDLFAPVRVAPVRASLRPPWGRGSSSGARKRVVGRQ